MRLRADGDILGRAEAGYGAPLRGPASPESGLGLTIVKAIVLRHGGKIVEASEPGHGTTISIELPSAVDVLAVGAAT